MSFSQVEAPMTLPMVSILMVAKNAEQFIETAILSAREQTIADIEIIVVDDGSSDRTGAIACAHAQHDRRVRVLSGPGRGLSAVRNASLAAARGRYAAILDSDDILHPRHVEWLVESHRRYGAEICASNMIEFQGDGEALTARAFAQGRLWHRERLISPEEFVERGMIGACDVSLGYLKPLLDLNFLRSNGVVYDERLRIGEDFDLVFRTMLAGGRFLYAPKTSYCYRKHATSTSHRLKRADVEALLRAAQEYDLTPPSAISLHIDARCDNLRGALLHLDILSALKSGQWMRALRLLSRDRDGRRLTLASLREALIKRIGSRTAADKLTDPRLISQDQTVSGRLREISQALSSAALSS